MSQTDTLSLLVNIPHCIALGSAQMHIIINNLIAVKEKMLHVHVSRIVVLLFWRLYTVIVLLR